MDVQDSDQVIRWAGGTPPVHPALLARPEVRAALAGHDIGAVFRVLNEYGWTQRAIGAAAGMRQSEVSEILRGRQVIGYRVLVRIADGLGIPREWMNLGPAAGASAYPGGRDTPSGPDAEVDEDVYRRALLALAGVALAHRPVVRARKVVTLPAPAPVPAPSRILQLHVVKVRELTRLLRDAGRAYGSDPEVSSAAAALAHRWLAAEGEQSVRSALRVAVAELDIHAGWAAFDAGLQDRTLHHYTQGIQLATEAGDAYWQTVALNCAGLAVVEHGHPNDGLKMLQSAHVIAGRIPAGEQRAGMGEGSRAALRACGQAYSVTALARMGDPEGAATHLAAARELRPTPTDVNADSDYVAANLALDSGRLDTAEPFAVASLGRWANGSRRARTRVDILLATIYVRAGEPDGLRLAHSAITGAMKLSSVRTRRLLTPLAAALDSRSGNDHRELARTARQVATTRA
jgi:transcriptional regulator with XRE-family HTH domain